MNPSIVTELDKVPTLTANQDTLLQSYSVIQRRARSEGGLIQVSDVTAAIPYFKPYDSKIFLDDILHIEKILWKEPSE